MVGGSIQGGGRHIGLSCIFDPNFYFLTRTHRILTSAESPYEVSQASVVVIMLSGRYICDYRTRHFDLSNPTGACRLCPSSPGAAGPPRTLEHKLLQCPAAAACLRQCGPALEGPLSSPPLAPACGAPLPHGATTGQFQVFYWTPGHVRASSGQPKIWVRWCITAATCSAGHGVMVFTPQE